MGGFDLDRALDETVRLGASDLHLKVPSAPRVRVHGELRPLDGFGELTPEDTLAVRDLVLGSEVKRRQFDENGSADVSYFTEASRFRVAVFTQRGSFSFVFRVVPVAPEVDQLGLPDVVKSWADVQRGLVVITGPTGAGKSTTSAAILDLINGRRACHILTIEDPIEFLHRDREAVVCQREIGLDAPTYHAALRAAMRQDPDVILIGEVRDEETAMTALRAAETGQLVISTMHTSGAAETVQRFVDVFPDRQVGLARQVLASTLVGVCSQRLVPGAQGGRVLTTEVLVNTARVRDLIMAGDSLSELESAVTEGDYYGMHTFDQCLVAQVNAGQITKDDALGYASNPHDFKLALLSSGGPAPIDGEAA
jgi:twitching motility protein PilT